MRPPGPAEVVVRVAGCALGVEPAAEISGVVILAGEAAREWLGRSVVVPRVLACGECARCRRGFPAACAGRAARAGLATHETVSARWLCEAPAGLELWQAAALADAVSSPYSALARAGVGPGEIVLIVGGGVSGAFTLLWAAALGARAALADSDPERVARARALGVALVLGSDLSPADARTALDADAAAAGLAGARVTVVETSAQPRGRARALALVPAGGTLVLLGGVPAGAGQPVDWDEVVEREVTILGCAGPHPDLLPETIARVGRGEIAIAPLLRRIAPDELAAALNRRRTSPASELAIVAFDAA